MGSRKILAAGAAASLICLYSASQASTSFQITDLACQNSTYISYYDQGLFAGKEIGESDAASGNSLGSSQGTSAGAAAAAAVSAARGTAEGQKVGYAAGYVKTYTNAYDAAYNTQYPIGLAAGEKDQASYNSGYSAGEAQGTSDGKAKGYNDGYNAGYNAYYQSGYNAGYTVGDYDGYNSGYSDGYNVGDSAGYSDGYSVGYADGESACYSPPGDGGSDGGYDGGGGGGGGGDGGTDGGCGIYGCDGGSDGGSIAKNHARKAVPTAIASPSSVCPSIGNLGSYSKDPTVTSTAAAEAYCTQVGCSTVVNPYQSDFNSSYLTAYNTAYTSGMKANTSYQSAYTAAYSSSYTQGESDGTSQGTSDGGTAGYNAGYTAGEPTAYQNGYNAGYAATYQAAYNTAYTDGYGIGETDGYNDGYNVGYSDGETVGYDDGYSDGDTDGYNVGYSDGYSAGYSAGCDAADVVKAGVSKAPAPATVPRPNARPKKVVVPQVTVPAPKTLQSRSVMSGLAHIAMIQVNNPTLYKMILKSSQAPDTDSIVSPAVGTPKSAVTGMNSAVTVVNPSPGVTDLQNSTQTVIASAVSLPSPKYTDNMNSTLATFTAPTTAAYTFVNFNSIDLENGYDYVTVYDSKGNVCAQMTGSFGLYSTAPCIGNVAKVVVTSDSAVSGSSGYAGISIAGYTYGVTTQTTPPQSVLTVSPTGAVSLGQSVSFAGNKSVVAKSGATMADYEWDYYDGSHSQASVASHAFSSPGTYWVSLTAWDSSEGYNTAYQTVTVSPVSAPKSPTATPSTTSVALKWTAGGTDDKSYIVAHTTAAKSGTLTCTGGTAASGTSSTVTGLAQGTAYTFGICAVNTYGGLSAPTIVNATTTSVAPPMPTNVKVTVDSTNTIAGSWTSGGGTTVGYVVASNPGKTALSCSKATSVGNKTTATAAGLQTGTKYTFTLCAVNSSGVFSAPFTATLSTLPPTPINVKVTTDTANAIGGSWQSGGTGTVGYVVGIVAGKTAMPCSSATNIGTQTSTLATGLASGTTYTVTLCAVDASGQFSVPFTEAGSTK
jgi:flagellar biosynthesis/type III secretory pathway protein FliH